MPERGNSLLGYREIGAVHVDRVAPGAVGLPAEDLKVLAFVVDRRAAFALGRGIEGVATPRVGQVPPALDLVGRDLHPELVRIGEAAPELLHGLPSLGGGGVR